MAALMEIRKQEKAEPDTSNLMSPGGISIMLVAAGLSALAGWALIVELTDEFTHPLWYWLIAGASVLMCVALVQGMRPRAEERLSYRLSSDSRAIRATARVMSLARKGTSEGQTMHRTGVSLTLAVSEPGGGERTGQILVWVEDALLPNFATGQTIHVLYDPDEPTRLAMDRRKTPTEVQ